MEPEPPPITIVNPNAPAGTADLLDAGHEPWRPSRTQALVGSVVVAVVMLVVGVTALVRHQRHERALDAAAAKDVAFFVDTEDTGPDDPAGQSLGIINEGRAPVRVLDVAIVGDGYGTAKVDADLPSYQTVRVVVPLGTSCPLSLLDNGPSQLRVRARTARGAVVTRLVALDPRGLDLLGGRERDRCGLLRVEDAIGTGGGTTVLHGSRLELTLALLNAGKLPVTISAVTTNAGIAARVLGLPLRIPARIADGRPSTVQLHVVLTVRSCARIREQLFGQPTFLPDGTVVGPSTLALAAANPYRKGTVMIDAEVNDFQPYEQGAPQGFPGLLVRSCPGLPLAVSAAS